MAYSALVSLTQTTHLILNPHRYTVSVHAKETITSIRDHAISLISLLDSFPTKANISESKTRDAAAEAEDILEHFMWKQLHDRSCAFGPSRVEFERQLKRAREEIASITGELPPSAPDVAHLLSLKQTIDLVLDPVKYSIPVVAKENIISIREYAVILASLAVDFPERARGLEGRIRDAAAEAECVIKELMRRKNPESWWSDLLPRVQFGQQSKRVRFGRQLRRVRSKRRVAFRKQLKRVRLGKQLRRVLFGEKLRRVRKEICSIGGYMTTDDLRDGAIASSRLASKGKNDMVIGLDEELMAIKLKLCGESSKLEVIPILGMGGIGKTTLARCAYGDRLTVEHFDVRCWITISQDYSAQDILSCLRDSMKSFDEQMLAHEDEATIREKVYKCLKGRRYLIVMDDVWSTKALDDVRNMFPDDHNGSRIMLTTRLLDVATYSVSDSLVHEMNFMDADQCWNLLEQKVFASTNGQGCPSELEDVGKEIAGSCGGLPLAVVLVAGVLSNMANTRGSWEEISKNLNSIVGEQSEEILSLSYTYLPHNLRSCFLYLGGFPEDHEVRVSELIRLWVAEGFLKCTNESKSSEEEAKEYLEDLVDRSLVLVSSRKSNGKIKSCRLHDLVRDLCIRKAREEKFLAHATDECAGVRRLSITDSNDLHYNIHSSSSTIRTILNFQRLQDSFSSSLYLLGGAKLLRVLGVGNDSEEHLPIRVFELFHLRYLASWQHTDILPTISKLENLHTLIINRKTNPMSRRLPIEIWRMPRLRHLIVYYLYELPDFPPSTLPLENLQTLLVVSCSRRFLSMLPNVKKLGLIYERNMDDGFHQLHNLRHLYHLEKLKVIMGDYCRVGRSPGFPSTLKKLTLSGGALRWEDMSVIGLLPNLQVLKLIGYACDGDTWETTDGNFPQLKFLLIEKSSLRDWITECSHFPKLKCLILRLCLSLSEIPDSIVEIPSLELIEVDYRNKRLVKSAKVVLEDQQSQGNYDLQVRIVGCLHESSSLEKTSGKKCYMIGAMELVIAWSDNAGYWQWKPCAESRFSVVAELKSVCWLDISAKIKTRILSSNTYYAAYLVFKLAERCRGLESAIAVVRSGGDEDSEGTHITVQLQQLAYDSDEDGSEKQNGTEPVSRDDGWMEVEMGSFYTEGGEDDDADDDGEAEARLMGIDDSYWKSGLIIEGIEFRPKARFDPEEN